MNDHDTSTSQTDRRTDRRTRTDSYTTCCGYTVLCVVELYQVLKHQVQVQVLTSQVQVQVQVHRFRCKYWSPLQLEVVYINTENLFSDIILIIFMQ